MQKPYLKSDVVLVEVNAMVEPEQRYMHMNIKNEMIEELIEHFEEGGHINRGTIARTIGRSMNLSDSSYSPRLGKRKEKLNIRRFRFFAHVVEDEACRDAPGRSYLISGFTDEIGDEDLVGLNKNSLIYINQIIELRSNLRLNRRGREYEHFSIARMFVVHRKDHRESSHHNGRPSDILIFYSLAEANELNLSDEDGDDMMAALTTFSRGNARAATVSDLSRNSFLNRLISADKSAMADSKTYREDDYDPDDEGFGVRRYANAATQYCDTPRLDRNNGFVNWMRTRSLSISTDMTFEYKHLTELVDIDHPTFDDLDDATTIVPIDDNDINYYSKELHGKSAKMQAVAVLCQELPAFMSECLLNRIEFTIDNETLDNGRPEYSIDDYSGVVDMDGLDEMPDVFINRVIDEIYLQVTNDNARYMTLHVSVTFGGMVAIEMEYEGSDEEEFKFPAFMSGLLSSNTCFDRKETNRLTKSYTTISEEFINRTVFGENGVDNEDEDDRDQRARRIADAFS